RAARLPVRRGHRLRRPLVCPAVGTGPHPPRVAGSRAARLRVRAGADHFDCVASTARRAGAQQVWLCDGPAALSDAAGVAGYLPVVVPAMASTVLETHALRRRRRRRARRVGARRNLAGGDAAAARAVAARGHAGPARLQSVSVAVLGWRWRLV